MPSHSRQRSRNKAERYEWAVFPLQPWPDGDQFKPFLSEKAASRWLRRRDSSGELRPDNWSEPVRLSWLDSYPGATFTGQRFQDFLKLDDIDESQQITRQTKFFMDILDRASELTCCLADDWQFDEITERARLGVGHRFHGRKTPPSLASHFVLCLYDVEDALFEVHPELPADAICDFWRSWQVSCHIQEFWLLYLRPTVPEPKDYNPDSPYGNALFFVRKEIKNYCYFISKPGAHAGAIRASQGRAGHVEEPAFPRGPQGEMRTASAHSEQTQRAGSTDQAPSSHKTATTDLALTRRKLVDDTIKEAREKGMRLTRKMIWQAAEYIDRTGFERWQGNRTGQTEEAKRNIERVLRECPWLAS